MKKQKPTEEEIITEAEKNRKGWLDDDGTIFRCRSCRRYYPVNMKSKKIGRCKLCRPAIGKFKY